jgi:thymidylate kinase
LGRWIVVTGLDGAGKTTLVGRLGKLLGARTFRLPFCDFVRPCLARSGKGSQFGDVHTDRLLFALDARLANYEIRSWREDNSALLISQRGFMDNFIFGAAQGVSYAETDNLLKTRALEKPTAQIFLIAEPSIAFARIKDDPNADKFETFDFIVRQQAETLRFLENLRRQAPELTAFRDIPTKVIDTSATGVESVLAMACEFLCEAAIAVRRA